jgi:hypothetical protein
MNLTAAQMAAKWWAEHLSGPTPDDFIDRLANLILDIPPLPWGDIEYQGESLSQVAPKATLPSRHYVQRINPWIVGIYDFLGNKFDLLDPTGHLTKIAPVKEELLDTLLHRVQHSTDIEDQLRCCRILQALPLTYSTAQEVLIHLLHDSAQPPILRYAVAQALVGGVYGNYDWAVPPIAEILDSSETDASLRYQLRQLMGMLLRHRRIDTGKPVGQQITGVVLNRDEEGVTLSDPRAKTYSYDDVPYWLATHDAFSVYIYVVSSEPLVIAELEPVPDSRRYLFICQNRRIDTLHLDDTLSFLEADRQALDHAQMLAQQHFEPVYVFHSPTSGGNVPIRDVGAAGTEYIEHDRLEDVIGVVYRLAANHVILRIGGYNRLIELSSPPDWLQNPHVVFSATARYDPDRDYLVILKDYQPLYDLKERDSIQYEIGNQIVAIRYTGDIADADRRAIGQAKRLTINQSDAITVSHRVNVDRIRLLTVVENGQEVLPLSNKPHTMGYWDL